MWTLGLSTMFESTSPRWMVRSSPTRKKSADCFVTRVGLDPTQTWQMIHIQIIPNKFAPLQLGRIPYHTIIHCSILYFLFSSRNCVLVPRFNFWCWISVKQLSSGFQSARTNHDTAWSLHQMFTAQSTVSASTRIILAFGCRDHDPCRREESLQSRNPHTVDEHSVLASFTWTNFCLIMASAEFWGIFARGTHAPLFLLQRRHICIHILPLEYVFISPSIDLSLYRTSIGWIHHTSVFYTFWGNKLKNRICCSVPMV